MLINFDYTIYFNNDSFHYGQGTVFVDGFNESAEDCERASKAMQQYVTNVITVNEWKDTVEKVLIDQIYYTKFLSEFEFKL